MNSWLKAMNDKSAAKGHGWHKSNQHLQENAASAVVWTPGLKPCMASVQPKAVEDINQLGVYSKMRTQSWFELLASNRGWQDLKSMAQNCGWRASKRRHVNQNDASAVIWTPCLKLWYMIREIYILHCIQYINIYSIYYIFNTICLTVVHYNICIYVFICYTLCIYIYILQCITIL